VVLLIVLTLLTLLVVVGLTFTVLSGQFRRAAESSARKERYGVPPDKLLDRAMSRTGTRPRRRTASSCGSSPGCRVSTR
ncbi:MAG: hypothetical protein MUF48_23645, partial [Pirellulaceae bacterium]|nr:hypothetical protein [Pirellulaceae bacterium]